jgi:peptidoglycan/xylan/chitin deacetylase (PgdA/CDA1 family)
MMLNLWSTNTPARFWCCQSDVPEAMWQTAIQAAMPILGMQVPTDRIDDLWAFVLGEAQFGPDHWRLSSAKRLYYRLKPLLPRFVTCLMRQFYHLFTQADFELGWPIEERYADFQWEVMRQLLIAMGKDSLPFKCFWPHGHKFALVLTHDVETAKGQAHIRAVADLEERLGFRSSFNFVPERYALDDALMEELRERGFEIGVHGLNHDGKLFSSHTEFMKRAERINRYLARLDSVGFRSPCTLRHPEWMQALNIEYDLSFFDTDPCEPLPGGVMSIWPFTVGRFLELPYTLVQDYTLTKVLGESSPQVWLTKVDFIEKFHGMVLALTHPDYLLDKETWRIYVEFLQAMKKRGGYWHALPRDVARWWRTRSDTIAHPSGVVRGEVKLNPQGITLRSIEN